MSDGNMPQSTENESNEPGPAGITWSVTCSARGIVGQGGLTFGEFEPTAPLELDRATIDDEYRGPDKNPITEMREYLGLADDGMGESDTDSATVSGHGLSDGPPHEQRAAANAERAGQSGPHSTIMASHRFECRLTGSESRRVVQALPMKMPASAVAMVTGVRAFSAREGVADVTCPVAGLEVGVELVDNALACTVRLSDFRAGESVLVQIDAAAYGVI